MDASQADTSLVGCTCRVGTLGGNEVSGIIKSRDTDGRFAIYIPSRGRTLHHVSPQRVTVTGLPGTVH